MSVYACDTNTHNLSKIVEHKLMYRYATFVSMATSNKQNDISFETRADAVSPMHVSAGRPILHSFVVVNDQCSTKTIVDAASRSQVGSSSKS